MDPSRYVEQGPRRRAPVTSLACSGDFRAFIDHFGTQLALDFAKLVADKDVQVAGVELLKNFVTENIINSQQTHTSRQHLQATTVDS